MDTTQAFWNFRLYSVHRCCSLLEEAKEAALIPPKHPNYPAVEDTIWQGISEALLGFRGIEEALRHTEAAAGRAAEGSR